MTFLIDSKKGFNWNITIGRKHSWNQQCDFISIVKEWREHNEVTYAVYVKGFFRKKS